mgnify:CR=1 FL=1
MTSYAHLLADLKHGASGAARQLPSANMFSEWNKQAIDFNPVFCGQFGFQGNHRLLRRPCFNISPAIRHPVDVNIDADLSVATCDTEHQVGALGSDALDVQQRLPIAGQGATVFFTVSKAMSLIVVALA